MVRRICTIVNALFFAVTFIYTIASPDIGPEGRREELTFYLLLALLFALVGAGLLIRKRWLVVVPSIPLMLAGALLALFMTAGGWIRGPLSAATVALFIIAGLGVALLELASIVTARGFPRRDPFIAPPPPS